MFRLTVPKNAPTPALSADICTENTMEVELLAATPTSRGPFRTLASVTRQRVPASRGKLEPIRHARIILSVSANRPRTCALPVSVELDERP